MVRPRTEPAPDRTTALWERRDNVWSHGPLGLRVAGGDTWAVPDSDYAGRANPSQDLMLTARDHDLFATVNGLHLDPAEQPAWLAADLELPGEWTDNGTLRLLGQDVPLRRNAASPPLVYHHARACDGERCVLALLHSTAALDRYLPAAVADSFVVERLAPDAAAALAERLAEADLLAEIGSTWAVRGGRAQFYDKGLAWRWPDRDWEVYAGDSASLYNAGASLVALHRATGTEMSVFLEDPVADARAHYIATYNAEPAEVGPWLEAAWGDWRVRTNHARSGALLVRAEASGPKAGEALSALELQDGPVADTAASADRFVNRRCGWAVPWSPKRGANIPSVLQKLGASTQFAVDGATIGITSVFTPMEVERFADTIAEGLVTTTGGTSTFSEGTFLGRESRRFVVRKSGRDLVVGHVTRHNGLLFMAMVEGPGVSNADALLAQVEPLAAL